MRTFIPVLQHFSKSQIISNKMFLRNCGAYENLKFMRNIFRGMGVVVLLVSCGRGQRDGANYHRVHRTVTTTKIMAPNAHNTIVEKPQNIGILE